MKVRKLFKCKDADCGEKFFWDYEYNEDKGEWVPLGGRVFCPFCDGENLKETKIKYPIVESERPEEVEIIEEDITLHCYECGYCGRKFYTEDPVAEPVCPHENEHK